ncbi:MAG: AAA family ATPase [Clostridiales Family XIII bacterium]|jgi:transitional endoplasmic reticulum ATPase|nr:AAA family ATPase [Clostridiales Family XIII bacterium]
MQNTALLIRFGRSASRKYKQAIELAAGFSDFTEAADDGSANTIRLPAAEWFERKREFDELYALVSGWKATSVSLNGEEIRPHEFFWKFNNVVKCVKGYEGAIDKERYCCVSGSFEGWGCKLLDELDRHLSKTASYAMKYWYRFGAFAGEGLWKIDKAYIKDYLKKEADEKNLAFCPLFSLDKAFTIVDGLPDEIDTRGSAYWEVEYREDFEGALIQKQPVGVRHKTVGARGGGRGGSAKLTDGMLKIEADEERTRFIPNVTFEDVGGIDDILGQIRETVELPLKRPDVYRYLGIEPHKGILFYGEPGTGKTLIAKAIANETNAHFIPVSGPELLSKWYGESESNLRDIFEEARELQPSIIFFDEIDSMAQHRSDSDGARVDSRFVNQLLALMDGMESYDNVTVLASTNRPELLDEALLRSGRFDYKIEIKRPDEAGCLRILGIATKNMPLAPGFELKSLVPKLLGSSGADIVFVAKEAAIVALRRSADVGKLIQNAAGAGFRLDGIKVGADDFMRALEQLEANKVRTE